MIEPALNSVATAELIVMSSDLASALALDDADAFPAVFATARMVALMEIAAARLLQPCLGPGQLSVGVRIDAAHSAPTPPGAKVTATARYLGHDGKLFRFEIIATDEAGEIGRGHHERAIIDLNRLLFAAAKRAGS